MNSDFYYVIFSLEKWKPFLTVWEYWTVHGDGQKSLPVASVIASEEEWFCSFRELKPRKLLIMMAWS